MLLVSSTFCSRVVRGFMPSTVSSRSTTRTRRTIVTTRTTLSYINTFVVPNKINNAIHKHTVRSSGNIHGRQGRYGGYINSNTRLYSTIDPGKAPLSAFTSLPKQYQPTVSVSDILPLKENQRLVCFGDVHGDLTALKEFLMIGKVYDDKKESWIGGNTILVQCGDVLDRGSQELGCFSLLVKLSHQAQAAGGQVILLWGNHEALNAAGLFQYTTGDEEYEANVGNNLDTCLKTKRWRLQFAGNQPARWASYEPGGLLAEALLANMKVAVQVGKTVCVHAGLTKKHLEEYGSLTSMNQAARDWIRESQHGGNNNIGVFDSVDQVFQEASDRARVTSKSMPTCLGGGIGSASPVWMRDYSYPPDEPPKRPRVAQSLIDDVLTELNADRMVMGHTVQSKINAALQGKAWRVDVGASRGVASGTPEVLEVVAKTNGEEVVSVLTKQGKIPADERLVVDIPTSFLSRL